VATKTVADKGPVARIGGGACKLLRTKPLKCCDFPGGAAAADVVTANVNKAAIALTPMVRSILLLRLCPSRKAVQYR